MGLLGRGGMGEVYRADDLVLGHPTALKFLPDSFASDPERVERFRAEVRVARQVSHPNVCRVYDIGEIDGHPFLSMEYIDGENLTSLLRRIGRLPHDTAADMARQLCAGLAAAHDKGVLHRDLKPANVMIDGNGKVRLADFGLAALAGDPSSDAPAGTPAYMAPELFAHASPSVASDIYALGLVLYEMFAGRPAFRAGTVGEIARLHRESMPVSLSRILTDADPVVDRVIERCLAKDPAERPASALAVAAALPGGDPLAAALAAGETPSPEMVAASGGVGALTSALGGAAVAAVGVALVAIVLLSARTQIVQYAPMQKAPEVLADQAQTVLRRLGYVEPPVDTGYGFTSTDYIQYLRRSDATPGRWDNLRAGQPPGFTFWYRQSPRDLQSDSLRTGGRLRLFEPPLTEPGMIGLMLDLQGRLHMLSVTAPLLDEAGPADPVDWSRLLGEAGLDLAALAPATPRWTPPVYADSRAAWGGVYPDRPAIAIHVEAAALNGKPVFFQIFEPWSQATLVPRAPSSAERFTSLLAVTAALALLGGALLLVRRNLALGRGDQAGASRLALVLFVLNVTAGLLSAEHSLDPFGAAGLLTLLVGRSLLISALVWMTYVALEPDLRRLSPQLLVSWTRLLAGRFGDPLVGRDVLIGVVAGVAMQLFSQLGDIAPSWIGRAPGTTLPFPGGPAAGMGVLVGDVLGSVGGAVLFATSLVLLVFLLTLLLRRRRLVALVFATIMTVLAIAESGVSATTLFDLAGVGITALIVLRFGLLAFVAMSFVLPILQQVPLTFDPDIWYSEQSWLVLAVVAALALYGSRTAVAGRRVV
jgi:serine/threonine-protein kinase